MNDRFATIRTGAIRDDSALRNAQSIRSLTKKLAGHFFLIKYSEHMQTKHNTILKIFTIFNLPQTVNE